MTAWFGNATIVVRYPVLYLARALQYCVPALAYLAYLPTAVVLRMANTSLSFRRRAKALNGAVMAAAAVTALRAHAPLLRPRSQWYKPLAVRLL